MIMHLLPSEIFLVYIPQRNHTPIREVTIGLFFMKLEVSRLSIIMPCGPLKNKFNYFLTNNDGIYVPLLD
jgi:hypothetical protein